ncbi:MAG: isoprenylcysteine carboxylmethyltransferase family protein [Burkholderiales bacterium]
MDIAGTITAATVVAYWLGIGTMIVRVRRHTRTAVGVIPEQRLERVMWILWVPLAAAWITLPILALSREGAPFGLPAFARTDGYGGFRLAAALAGAAALGATIKCWSRMGKDWRMAVTAEPDQPLITDGLFGRIRHPIYAFSILLVLSSIAVVPTAPMVACGAALITLWVVKAVNEERHMLRQHGDTYAAYLARTGRFLPRF